MDIRTETITVSITLEAASMLRAITKARNGQLGNQVDAIIRVGVRCVLDGAPEKFKERYNAAMKEQEIDNG